jgi:hypothetical protein
LNFCTFFVVDDDVDVDAAAASAAAAACDAVDDDDATITALRSAPHAASALSRLPRRINNDRSIISRRGKNFLLYWMDGSNDENRTDAKPAGATPILDRRLGTYPRV